MTELSKCLAALEIDRDHLDDCVSKQPELFYHVSEQYVLAVAERDSVKLDLDEALAEEGDKVRDELASNEEKMTETGIKQRVKTIPRIKTLQRDFNDCKLIADKWQALKEAYLQRYGVLPELVRLHLSRMNRSEGSLTPAREALREAEADHRATQRARRPRGI